ncbi:carbon storage regulator [Candidatus Laterigemmans baculatus]|uniref:carbon storage regulator n=1 Tax=Candidatus Laterigemmans baculatus TaxID=2770505 RepID=UPI0013DAA548|nr:carbon storage regulator [Candidatus Laterigemmans baculatus]
MLVLTRKVNQQIRLGEEITITVLRVQGNSIRLGVEAPRDVRVLRGELEPHQAAAPRQAPATEKLEFDLEFDGSELASVLAATESAPANAAAQPATEKPAEKSAASEPQVYQMRTVAPLSRFVRTAALSTMAVR